MVKGDDAWRLETISFQLFDGEKKSKPYVFEVNQWFSTQEEDIRSIGAITSKMFSFRPDSEANQSPAATPDAKIAQVTKINLDDPETRKKIIAKAVDDKKLQSRGEKGEELVYARNQQTPYTGWSKGMFQGNKQTRRLDQYKDGKVDGLVKLWYRTGRKRSEAYWKDGKMLAIVVWKPNGDKCPVTKVVNGNGVRAWYKDDGTESFRVTIKDGVKVED